MSQYADFGTPFTGRAPGAVGLTRDRAHEVFGQVMALVSLTVACTALGAYAGRNLSSGVGIVFFVAAFGCVFGLNAASGRDRDQLAIGLLLGVGLFLGLAVAPEIAYYARTDPAALWQASGATSLFIAGLGTFGYSTRRDLSSWARTLFWALLGLIVVGIVGIFVAIPGGNVVYCLLGLVVFGGYTVFDFNRLRRADKAAAVPIAASIFLDIFNVFLLLLQLFSGNRD